MLYEWHNSDCVLLCNAVAYMEMRFTMHFQNAQILIPPTLNVWPAFLILHPKQKYYFAGGPL